MSDDAEWLFRAAEEFEPSDGAKEPGELRLYLRANYDALMKIKKDRKLSWAQIAAMLAKRGLTKQNGAPLDANIVAVTASAVRWERGNRRKRRPARPKAAQAAPPSPTRSEVPEPPPVSPTRPEASQTGPPATEAPNVPVADPELARRLNTIRTVTDVPPADFGAGWRRKGEQGNG